MESLDNKFLYCSILNIEYEKSDYMIGEKVYKDYKREMSFKFSLTTETFSGKQYIVLVLILSYS